jgi:hypothetical protein
MTPVVKRVVKSIAGVRGIQSLQAIRRRGRLRFAGKWLGFASNPSRRRRD